jgi:hypothetical protein
MAATPMIAGRLKRYGVALLWPIIAVSRALSAAALRSLRVGAERRPVI